MSDKEIPVLHITTSFGKRYTCRTVDELAAFYENYKRDKKLKRDEDVDIQIGFGRLSKAAFNALPACKYFVKPLTVPEGLDKSLRLHPSQL